MPAWQVTVLTYPKHFFMTALTLQSLNYVHGHNKFNVVFDDVSSALNWSEYPTVAKEYLQAQFPSFDFSFYNASKLDDVAKFDWGWIRQQIIKCNIDLLVPGDHLLVDGDFLLQREFLEYNVPIRPDWNPDYFDVQFNNYLKYISKDNTASYLKIDGMSYSTSSAPVRYVTANMLTELRNWVEKLHGVPFNQLHLNLIESNLMRNQCNDLDNITMSEWELIEYYRAQFGYKQIFVDGSISVLPDVNGLGATMFGRDSDFPRQWFVDQDITIPVDIWKKTCSFE